MPARKQFALIGCGMLLIFAAAFAKARNLSGGYEIVLSKPALNGNAVSGWFKFRPKHGGPSWNGTGGACFVADIASLVPASDAHKGELNAGACTTQEDCLPAGDAQKWWGYCVPEPNKKAGRCWYKPSEAEDGGGLCRRSIDYAPEIKLWTLNEVYPVPDPARTPFDVNAFYGEHTGGKSANWALVGVLNNDEAQHVYYGHPAKL